MLSDVKVDYPLDVDFRQQIQNVKSKIIIDDFSILLDRVEELYGLNVSFNFKDEDVIELVNSVALYDEDIKKRIIRILIFQRNRMNYYFNSND